MDTDHLSLYERAHPKVCDRIIKTRQHSSETLFTTVVSLEEQYAGRIAQIRKATTPQALVGAYDKLKQIFAKLISTVKLILVMSNRSRY